MSELRQIVTEVLIAAADAGLIYLFYKMYRDKCSAAENIEVRKLGVAEICNPRIRRFSDSHNLLHLGLRQCGHYFEFAYFPI